MNLFDISVNPVTGEERFDTLFESGNVTIERICSNMLKDGEWYDQERDEWVVLFQGNAVIELDHNVVKSLSRGDHLFIKAHERHRVLSTSHDALWLALHFNA